MLKIGIVIETENKMSGGLGLEGWGKGELADGHGVSLSGHENILLNGLLKPHAAINTHKANHASRLALI